VSVPGDPEAPANAPSWTAAAGVSTPKLWGRAHVSTELLLVGAQHTRDAATEARAWTCVNLTVYVPDLRRFDVTLGVRNLLGQRQDIVASDDFDRTDPTTKMTTVVPVIPGEGREVFARVGYRY